MHASRPIAASYRTWQRKTGLAKVERILMGTVMTSVSLKGITHH